MAIVRHMRVALLLAAAGCALAQLEPDNQPAASVTTTPTSPSLTSLLRDKVVPAKQQQQPQASQRSQTTNLPTTTVRQQQPTTTTPAPAANYSPSSSSSSSVAASQLQSQQQVTTTTTTTTTTTQVPNAPAAVQEEPKFQYVKPLSLRCQHNNQSYTIGQRWNDDCDQVCECVSNDDPVAPLAISACRPRCPTSTYKDPPGPGCNLQRSKVDECCLDWVCDSEGKLATSATTTTLINTERGQLNVSTTEIKLPSSSGSTQSAWQAPTGSGAITTTTTVAAPLLSSVAFAAGSQAPITQAPATTTTRVASSTSQQAAKVITTTLAPATTRAPAPTTTIGSTSSAATSQRAATTQSTGTGANRSPKAVDAAARTYDVTVTQSPIGPTSPRAQTRSFPQPTSTSTTTEVPAAGDDDEGVDPKDLDLCIVELSIAYKVNESWLANSCNQTCRCVFRSEPRNPMVDVSFQLTENLKPKSEQTEIRCGLPQQCAHIALQLTPTPECPAPRLRMPQLVTEKCACPRVDCGLAPARATTLPGSRSSSIMTTTSTTTTTTTGSPPVEPNNDGDEQDPLAATIKPLANGCLSRKGDRLLSFGETFNDECHSTCRCHEDSQIRCQQLVCPPRPAADSACSRWEAEPNFAPNSTENMCCPTYHCSEPATVKPAPPRFRSCHMLGSEIPHGQRLPEEIQPRLPECDKACVCNDGKIVCDPICPPVGDTPPDGLDCPLGQVYKASDGCCLKWSCPIMEEYALEAFEIAPLNATAVEVNFTLPLFALNRQAKAELNYTGVPLEEASLATNDLPPAEAQWTRKANIKTANGVFPARLVKYYLNNLKPAHKYWFKLVVRFQDAPAPLDEPLESGLQRVVMPPLMTEPANSGDISSSTTTTTASPAPPSQPSMITLYPKPAPPSPSRNPHNSAGSVPSSSTTTTSTTTTTTTTTEQPPVPVIQSRLPANQQQGADQNQSSGGKTDNDGVLIKPDINELSQQTPCGKSTSFDNSNNNQLDDRSISLPLTDRIVKHSTIQAYAVPLLYGLCTMTTLFFVVLILYLRKSSHTIVPITSQSAYDNPSFTKLKSYNPQTLLIDETIHQNYNNDVKQKNLEVEKSSPFHHHHQLSDLHLHNGRQHLI